MAKYMYVYLDTIYDTSIDILYYQQIDDGSNFVNVQFLRNGNVVGTTTISGQTSYTYTD